MKPPGGYFEKHLKNGSYCQGAKTGHIVSGCLKNEKDRATDANTKVL